MKSVRQTLWLAGILLCFSIQASPQTHCDTSPALSAPIANFDAGQVSPIEALLRLGEKHNLCFGIEYVDKPLLAHLQGFHVQNTTIEGAIESMFGAERPLRIELHYGVIEISRKTPRPKVTNIFDHVIPKWEARRGPLQLVSWLLHIQLATDLNPQIQGFGGHFAGGDLRDEVGPFSEHKLPVKYLLDKIVAQSKGATWIAQVPWGLLHDLALPEDRRIWTILEYEGPGADYASQLRGIAAQPEFDAVDNPRQ